MAHSEFTHRVQPSTCPYCGVGCGVQVTTQNDRVISVCGDNNHPANLGKLCVKGTNLAQTTGLDGRLLYPSVDGVRVGWDEATQRVADKISQSIHQYGPESVAFYVSGQILTEDYYVANKLMKGFIGSANIDTNSRLCMSSAVAAYKRAFGSDTVPCNYDDLSHADCLLLIGSNAAWTHPILFQRMEQAKQNNPNMQIICIDPRHSATTELADLHCPIAPGTDIVFFNGLLHYLISQDMCDLQYIAASTQHFDGVKSRVDAYSIDYVSAQCQVNAEAILRAYQCFAQADNALSFYSQGVNQSRQGVDKANSIINCHLATGQIGRPGTGPFSITGQPNAMGGREVGGLANMLAAHMDIDNPTHREWVQTFWDSPHIPQQAGLKAVDLFEQMRQGKIKVLWVMATNPAVSLPNHNVIAQALKRCDTVIVSECYSKNDTLAYADIVLPASTWSEKDGTVTNSERRISRQRGVVPAPGEAKHDWQIICEVATKMGHGEAFNYTCAAQIFDEHARLSALNNGTQDHPERDFDISGLVGLTQAQYDTLAPISWPVNAAYPYGCARMFEDGRFYTPSGRANFIACDYIAPVEGRCDQYPFILNSGRYRDQWHTMTRTARSAALTHHQTVPLLDLHPNDIDTMGLTSGDWVHVASRYGSVDLQYRSDAGVRPGNAFVPIHWTKQQHGSSIVSACFSSRNDAISGQPDSKFVAVKLTPISPLYHCQWVAVAEERVSIPKHVTLHHRLTLQHGVGGEMALAQTNVDRIFEATNQDVGESTSPVWTAWLKQCLSTLPDGSGEWITYHNSATDELVIVNVLDDQLQYFAKMGPQHRPVSWQWLDECMAQEHAITPSIGALLTQTEPANLSRGKLICSCYQVGEKTIIDAVNGGADSVDILGQQLQCGTNCGSCKPELQQCIDATLHPKPKLIYAQ